MALTADQITAKNFKEFYDKIFPYLNGGLARNNYSTDEQVVGTWIDGKPLYQKTVSCGTLPNKTTKNVPHGISNLGFIVSAYGTALATNGAVFNMPYVSDNSINTQIALVFTSTEIAIHSAGADRSNFTQSYITIQYTKTTD